MDEVTTWCDSAATGVSLSYSSLAAALEGQVPAPASAQDQVSAAWCPHPGPMGQDTQQGHFSLHPHRHPLPGCRLGFPRWCFQAGRQAPWRPGWAGMRQGQKRVVGDARHYQGTRTRGRFLSQECPAVGCGTSTHPKVCGAGLVRDSVFQPHACLFGKRSLYAIAPQPYPAGKEATPYHTLPVSSTPLGRDPCCTHCKKCTFGGRGWGDAEQRDPELPKKGLSGVSIHRTLRGEEPPPPLSQWRWEVRASGLKCLIPTACPPLSS